MDCKKNSNKREKLPEWEIDFGNWSNELPEIEIENPEKEPIPETLEFDFGENEESEQ